MHFNDGKSKDILNFNISSKFTVYKVIYTLINVGEIWFSVTRAPTGVLNGIFWGKTDQFVVVVIFLSVQNFFLVVL